jgi:hypothetical protein
MYLHNLSINEGYTMISCSYYMSVILEEPGLNPYLDRFSVALLSLFDTRHVLFLRIQTQGTCVRMDICVCLFCVSVILCVDRGLASGWSPIQGAISTRSRNWQTSDGRTKGCRAIIIIQLYEVTKCTSIFAVWMEFINGSSCSWVCHHECVQRFLIKKWNTEDFGCI